MATKLFGQFLLERGAISRETLLEAVKHQKSIVAPLCALAIEQGYFTKEQMVQLDAERQRSDKAYVEIARQSGVLTAGQFEALSQLRSDRWVLLGEAILEKGFLTLAQMDTFLEEYRREQGGPDPEVRTIQTAIPHKDMVQSFIQITVDVFRHYTKKTVKALSIERASQEPGDITYVFAQKVTGEMNFCYALAMPEELTVAIGSQMLQEKYSEISAIVLDAVSEFVNVVVGNGCAKLNMRVANVSAEAPQVMMREMLAKILPKEAVAVKMRTEEGDFQILFLFAGQDGQLPESLV